MYPPAARHPTPTLVNCMYTCKHPPMPADPPPGTPGTPGTPSAAAPLPDPVPDDAPEAMVSAFITLVVEADRAPGYRARIEAASGRSLPRSAISILFVLHRHGPLGVKEIAERLGVEQSTASRQIRPLEEHGLVHRDTDPRDGRAVRLHLTEAGLDVRERVRQVWLRDISTVWRDWDPAERAQLATLLTRFRDSFRELRGGD
ncbi:hypothetical protein GCM10023205_34510 [Yinghuangia aomiensis]|uniref:HTH marR-type domain-containing protein n=2 Tax=Yinghuangia aomiensis TaxID=676205 RepID=A0ABP9HC30_9ACTN